MSVNIATNPYGRPSCSAPQRLHVDRVPAHRAVLDAVPRTTSCASPVDRAGERIGVGRAREPSS
jgi:hypothetical protein